ncbi:olfactory receptor 14J1-like [Pipra filicauda]|uniref:Olfactory receptor n=1 Tax=Pipra filicauda TaxID=649802 RepID=A0A7R5KLV9_9PASS|nr:olfactory receptor 14J1-like [Pipra filicauda]
MIVRKDYNSHSAPRKAQARRRTCGQGPRADWLRWCFLNAVRAQSVALASGNRGWRRGLFVAAEYFLLTIMCYDRYVAICKPLHYGTLLGSRACAHMAAAAWATGFLNALLHTANTFSLPLCQGNALGQFFCEIPHILKLSCSHSGSLREIGLIGVGVCLVFGCFVFIVFSYVQIFRAVLRIPSQQGRHKAFSTCLPHLTVVSLFLSTATFSNLKPPSISSPSLDLIVSVLYSVVPPALNPLIYSLRNQELKDALRKMMTGCFSGATTFLSSSAEHSLCNLLLAHPAF